MLPVIPDLSQMWQNPKLQHEVCFRISVLKAFMESTNEHIHTLMRAQYLINMYISLLKLVYEILERLHGFLGAPPHLYKRLCPSVGQSVGPLGLLKKCVSGPSNGQY